MKKQLKIHTSEVVKFQSGPLPESGQRGVWVYKGANHCNRMVNQNPNEEMLQQKVGYK